MNDEFDVDAVGLVLHLRRGNLDVDEALIETVGGNGIGIALKVFLLEHAGTREPREHASGLESQVLVHVALVEFLDALDVHFLDIELVAFIDRDDQHGTPAAGAVLKAVAGLGKIEAVLAIQLGDLLQVIGKHLLIEHAAGLGTHGRDNVLGVHLMGPFDDDIVDARLFHHGKDQDIALQRGLNIAEIAHVPDALHFFIDGVGIRGVTLADGQAHQDGIRIEHVHAAHLNVRQAAGGGGGRAHGHQAGA